MKLQLHYHFYRQYIINVIMTLVGQPFAQWVKKRVDARHKKVAEEAEMHIHMDPEINEIYRNSKAVSGKFSPGFIIITIIFIIILIFIFYFQFCYSQQREFLQLAQGIIQKKKRQRRDQGRQGTRGSIAQRSLEFRCAASIDAG